MPGPLRGALVAFTPSFIGLVPNVIVFQFNPETITHTWTAAPAAQPADKTSTPNPLAVKGVPGETFSFKLLMDSNDMIADGATNPVGAGLAMASGVYPRLAALEMLQYPTGSSGGGLLGGVSASISSSGINLSAAANSSASQTVPQSVVPTVLFVYGPQRIVPVRVTALTITEQIYDGALNPSHAEAQITLRVLTPDEIVSIDGPMKPLANIAYVYTQGLRQAQALANLGDAAATIIGMLPTPF